MNARPLAISRHSDLRQRPRGKLHWEKDIAAKDRSEIVNEGDKDALQAYIEANRQSLEAEAAAIRKHALDVVADGGGNMPMNNAEWLAWIEEHDEQFKELLKTATRVRRDLGKKAASSK